MLMTLTLGAFLVVLVLHAINAWFPISPAAKNIVNILGVSGLLLWIAVLVVRTLVV